jgi:BirA family transcriptional regulator, biotin operon repressor / biotin---[acetyl-CoA-carboxylase] ligase
MSTLAFDTPFALTAQDYAPAPHISLTVVRETGSTNSDLLAQARAGGLPAAGSSQAAALIAHTQHAGRGRQGRAWHGQGGASLLMSVAVLRHEPAGAFAAMTVALGVVAAQTLQAMHIPVQLKWPNDLLLGGAKLGGLLVESASTREGTALVAGIGINGVLSGTARSALAQPAAALADVLPLTPAAAARVGHTLLHAFAQALCAPQLHTGPLLEAFNALHAYHDAAVTLLQDGTPLTTGQVHGIDMQGRLLLHDGTAMRAFSSGEVSLRPQ